MEDIESYIEDADNDTLNEKIGVNYNNSYSNNIEFKTIKELMKYYNIYEIANELGISIYSIKTLYKKNGESYLVNYLKENKDYIFTDRHSGMSYVDLAKKYNVTYSKMYGFITRNNKSN